MQDILPQNFRKISNQEIAAAKPTVGQVRKMARTRVSVFLDNIRSIHNVGAIFRTSDAILAEKLYLCGITGHPPRADLEKTSLGAVSVVPWEYLAGDHGDLDELKKMPFNGKMPGETSQLPSVRETLLKMKADGVKICALELAEGAVHYKEAQYQFPMALILGNEVEGVSDGLMEICDMAVYIPMLGRANSLNVATAYGIVGYEILDQYMKFLKKNAQL